jgi:hypothetical protein
MPVYDQHNAPVNFPFAAKISLTPARLRVDRAAEQEEVIFLLSPKGFLCISL